MLANCVRQPLHAFPAFAPRCHSFSTLTKEGDTQAPKNTPSRPRVLRHAVGLPLTPLDDKYAEFLQSIEKTIIPGREAPNPSDIFVNPLRIRIYQPVKSNTDCTKLADGLQSIRETLATVGPIKLNIGQLYALPVKGNQPADPSKFIARQISLRPSLNKAEMEKLNKLFRTVTDKLKEDGFITRPANDIPIPTVTCIPTYIKVVFNTSTFVESLKKFGATDLSGLKTGGDIAVDLGNFKINEITLEQLLHGTFTIAGSEPLAKIEL
ncbi:hypothetical protein M422DRAFT_29524 [Sphaerobolus stellatus SS14]|uniref:Uncharacterized protein n=1 Tax=Sphaerobolus stellatus (strain SS14) TaxID=990650 RepID=A0A0C9W3Q0_SPHS4|nr:hypothetical protein M422DRAFT_29524 [Sphaerobolus stellatus SS14]